MSLGPVIRCSSARSRTPPVDHHRAGNDAVSPPLPPRSNWWAFAFQHGRQGDLFVRKAPACRVIDLARALTNRFASTFRFKSSMRHGEKLFETLATWRRAGQVGRHGPATVCAWTIGT